MKLYDNTFKKSSRRKCSKVIFIIIKICRTSYMICCYWIGTSLIGVEMNLGHAHKTRFWYLFRGVLAIFRQAAPSFLYKNTRGGQFIFLRIWKMENDNFSSFSFFIIAENCKELLARRPIFRNSFFIFIENFSISFFNFSEEMKIQN